VAVEFVSQAIHVYQGLAADEKPVAGVPIGSLFRETDGLRDRYILTQSRGWVISDVEIRDSSSQERLLDVLERIQQQLGKVNEDQNLNPGERHYE